MEKAAVKERTENSDKKNVKKMPCDTYSRVTGYFQPVRFWNPGKLSEFKERHTDKVPESIRSDLMEKKEHPNQVG